MRKKPPRGDRGFTLVELIVAVALLAVITPILTGLITAGAGFYRGISAELALQRDTRIIMAQLREYVIDCTGIEITKSAGDGGAADGSASELTAERASLPGEYTFSFEKDRGVLWLSVGEITDGSPAEATAGVSAELADGVLDFDASLIGGGNAVEVRLELERGGKIRTSRQVIFMRNIAGADGDAEADAEAAENF
jgi:prepilin-type N-terminal cleavage/methylation domain-containing protein